MKPVVVFILMHINAVTNTVLKVKVKFALEQETKA